MEPLDAASEMREHANGIAVHVTAMHRLVPNLGNPAVQTEVFKALYELTRQVEIVKKQMIKLEKGDGSSLV